MSIQNSDQEVINVAFNWLESGHTVYLVTVARTWGSSPRPVGSLAAVRSDGELVGSVSGGCVEKQLVESLIRENEQGTESKASDKARHQISTLHVNDEQAKRFGLSCGGELELVFEPLSNQAQLAELLSACQQRQTIKRTVNLDTGDIDLVPVESLEDVKQASQRFHYDKTTVSKVFGPDWRILIIGAGQLSRYTAEFATALDYEVVVCEPRPGFKQAWQIDSIPLLDMSPDDAVIQHASDANSAVLALTHDPNVDDLALLEALPSNAFYVGALGSQRNYEKRKVRLSGLGLNDTEIDRLVGPIGLDIGSRTSAEIAISIIAHLVKVRNS